MLVNTQMLKGFLSFVIIKCLLVNVFCFDPVERRSRWEGAGLTRIVKVIDLYVGQKLTRTKRTLDTLQHIGLEGTNVIWQWGSDRNRNQKWARSPGGSARNPSHCSHCFCLLSKGETFREAKPKATPLGETVARFYTHICIWENCNRTLIKKMKKRDRQVQKKVKW